MLRKKSRQSVQWFLCSVVGLLIFYSTVNAQQGVVRPSVVSTFGNQVGSSLAQYIMRGDLRLASDIYLTEVRASYGYYELSIYSGSRLIATIPHSIGRRSSGVTVDEAVNSIVNQLVRRRLGVVKR